MTCEKDDSEDVFLLYLTPHRQQWEMTGMGDVLEQVSAVSEQMVHYGLNKEELLLLQATVLVNAGWYTLSGY